MFRMLNTTKKLVSSRSTNKSRKHSMNQNQTSDEWSKWVQKFDDFFKFFYAILSSLYVYAVIFKQQKWMVSFMFSYQK